MSIMGGIRPERPNHPGFTESLWALTQRCWSKEAQDRPEIWEAIEALKDPLVSCFIYTVNASLTHRLRSTSIGTHLPLDGSVGEREPLKNAKRAKESREKFEVPCNPHLFRRNLVLTPSQKQERQKLKTGEREVMELEGRPKVCGPPSNGCCSDPTTEGREAEGAQTRGEGKGNQTSEERKRDQRA